MRCRCQSLGPTERHPPILLAKLEVDFGKSSNFTAANQSGTNGILFPWLLSAVAPVDCALMKLVRWTQFTWDLAKLPAVEIALAPNYAIRQATAEEHKIVHKTIFSAFSLDMDWSDTLKILQDRLEAEIGRIFEQKKIIDCLVVTHGSRVIGASALDTRPDAENHLLTGPAILSEYRNRGIGSKLLYGSLQALREAGLVRAQGIIKDNVLAAKYVYPKFDSSNAPCEYAPRLPL